MRAYLNEQPVNEEARLNALRDLRLLDTPPSESFDRLTRLASRLLDAPVSTITLTDKDRLWFKSRVGIDATEVPRDKCPCNYATMGRDVFVVPDLLEDERFRDGVVAEAGIRFYAGAPLISAEGYGLGTICVVDDTPRDLDDDQKRLLRDLADMVMAQINLQSKIGRIDPVSGHPNQQAMLEDLEDAAQTRSGEGWALLVDLGATFDGMDGQNVLGSEAVEALLRGVIARVAPAFSNGGSLYHLGECRLGLLLSPETSVDLAEATRRVTALLEEAVLCGGIPVQPMSAIGMCRFEHGTLAPREVMRRLMLAGDAARRSAERRAEYCPLVDARKSRQFRLLQDFHTALDAPDQLALAYQPRIDLQSLACPSVEALLRWTHPGFGAVAPDEFIPHVERTALCRRLTDWVVAEALRQARVWHRAGRALKVSINASALNLEEPDFADRLIASLDRAGVAPRHVELEFTESAMGSDNGRVIDQLAELRGAGIEIAIDDFGSGYSNLSYLQRLPASVLKIDRRFVLRLDTSARDQKLVQTVIRMAQDLGYRTVAEGVETAETLARLQQWGCDEAQGFYFSKAIRAADLEAWLDAGGAVARGRAA